MTSDQAGASLVDAACVGCRSGQNDCEDEGGELHCLIVYKERVTKLVIGRLAVKGSEKEAKDGGRRVDGGGERSDQANGSIKRKIKHTRQSHSVHDQNITRLVARKLKLPNPALAFHP